MTDEQKQRKLEANRAYRERQKLKKAPKQPSPYEYTPTPEHEERWRMVQTDGKPISAEDAVEYVSNREKAEAVVSEAVAREECVEMLFKQFERCTNVPQLLQGIIRELITLRVTLTDLIGGLK